MACLVQAILVFDSFSERFRMKLLDRILIVLLILGGVGHTFGCIAFYRSIPLTLLWALCASLFIFLLGAINFLRTVRPDDRPLAMICCIGCFCWVLVVLTFGHLIGNLLDPRVYIQAAVALALCAMSLRTFATSRHGAHNVS